MANEEITANEALREVFKTEESPYTLPSPLDSLNREKFDSDAAYMEAAADLAAKRKTPEFVQAYNEVSREQQKREQAKAVENAAAAIKEARKTVKIDQNEIDAINVRATEWARTELRNGRIDPRKTSAEIKAYVDREIETLRHKKAESKVLSDAIRSCMGAGNEG